MKAEQLFSIEGQVAVVTGAAAGLGRAYAEVLAANHAHVVLTDIDPGGLADAVAEIQSRGGSAEALVLDSGDRDAIGAAIDKIAAAAGRLDIVFANAGISAGPGFAFTPGGLMEQVQPEVWDRVLAVNLTGVFATIRAAAQHMKAARRGRIIVTASIAGMRAETLVGYAYSATKAAVINLVRHTAMELAPYSVTVNAIAPGPFATNIAGGRMRDPTVRERFAKLVPMQRVADPDEIKGLALLLASPASAFITGTVIPIDGGATAGS
ncbi:MAG: SDR family NAD(P)-dependent oxidoreductase [Betaproteobacteria bacterium]